MADETFWWAWCFSHGRMHTFRGDPWCGAMWAPLDGATEDEALAEKRQLFGDAQFDDALPMDVRVVLIHLSKGARAGTIRGADVRAAMADLDAMVERILSEDAL